MNKVKISDKLQKDRIKELQKDRQEKNNMPPIFNLEGA